MRRLAHAIGLVLVTVALAGCMGGGGEAGETQPQSTYNDTGPTLEEPNVSFADDQAVYTFEAASTNETIWENGSFSPASCFACPDGERRIDITSSVPSGTPALVRAEVDADANLFDGTSVDIVADGGQIYDENSTLQTAQAVLAAQGGTVEVVVQNSFPDANTEISYELRIQIDANRSRLPADVPVELPAPENPAGLVVEPDEDADGGRLMLWDGQDAFLGHHALEGRTTINVSQAEGGPLVAYLAGVDGTARLAPVNASASDTSMRPLGLSSNEASTSISSGDVEVVAEPETTPLQAGLFVQGDQQAGTQYSGELTNGNATLISFESGAYYTGFGARFVWMTERGAPELAPGEHLGTFQFSQATGGEAGVQWTMYKR